MRKLAWIIFNAPDLFCLINSIAFIAWHPLWTKANATNSGARPNPAKQWTPIRAGFVFYFSPKSASPRELLLASFVSSLNDSDFFIAVFFLYSFNCNPLLWSYIKKKSSTIFNHFSIISFSGNIPSGKVNSDTLISACSNISSS